MKRVLIITYYWPPSGGAGVQRWLKFVKYLPEFGWDPIVYAPENPEAPADDPSLHKDIHPGTTILKKKIREPYQLYKRFLGMRSEERINAGFLSEKTKPGMKERLSIWIRGNLFIPDAKCFWINPSVRFLRKYLASNPVDAFVTTGPPHSIHLIGLKLKKQVNIPWIADFRDPWTDIDFYDQLRLTRKADQKHRNLEKAVLQSADTVVAIGHTMAEKFNEQMKDPVVVIPNGYDTTDFNDPIPAEQAKTTPDTKRIFSIIHVGAMNRDRNHKIFWKAISDLTEQNKQFASDLIIRLVGKLDISVQQSIAEHNLERFVEKDPYIPHDQIAPLLQSASILFLPINNTPNARSIHTGKLFEYLAAGRPILGIGPTDGDAAEILNECKSGQMINFDDLERLKQVLTEWYALLVKGGMIIQPGDIEKYSRKNLTRKLAELMNKLTEVA